MTVRVYRWDDASAPVLSGTIGDLAYLLNKCLVTGYGSKTAAGWSSAYSDANGYSRGFVNSVAAGGSGYGVLINHSTAAAYASIRGFESIDGSGNMTNQFPTTAQLTNGMWVQASSTANSTPRPWLVIADEKRFYLWVGSYSTTAQGLTLSSDNPVMFAGDIVAYKPDDLYRFMVIGNESQGTGSSLPVVVSSLPSTTAGSFLARSLSGAAVSQVATKCLACFFNQATTMGKFPATNFPYPDPVSGAMNLTKALVLDGMDNKIRGHLPGLYAPMHQLPGNPGDTFSGSGILMGKSFILLDSYGAATGVRGRIALETSDTWD